MAHKRQAPNVSYDELGGRYYVNDKAKQQAFRDKVGEDKDLQRGVTIARRGADFDSAKLKTGRTRWILGGD